MRLVKREHETGPIYYVVGVSGGLGSDISRRIGTCMYSTGHKKDDHFTDMGLSSRVVEEAVDTLIRYLVKYAEEREHG